MAEVQVGDANWRDGSFGDGGKGMLYVFFYNKQVKNDYKSKQAGVPKFETRTMIKKLVPADPRVVIDTFATEADYEAFPVEYARFQQKAEARPEGTPIDAWQILSDSQKAEFRALNIFTVEQFANLPDSAGTRIMGFGELRKKARAFVLAQEAGEKLVEMQDKAKAAIEKDAEQAKVIAELTARLAALEKGGSGTLHAKRT